MVVLFDLITIVIFIFAQSIIFYMQKDFAE